MKKWIAIVLIALMSLSAAACGSTPEPKASDAGSSDAQMRLLEPGKLILATEATYPPWEMRADDGEGVAGTGLTGADIEIAAAVAEKLGLELVVNDVTFDQALLSVQNGKADIVMAGIDITTDRERILRFSAPYAEVVQIVVVRDDDSVERIEDLKDKKAGCVAGTTGYIFFMDDLKQKNVIVYDDYAAAVAALQRGEVDGILLDEAVAEAAIAANDGLKKLSHTYSEEDYAIGVAPDNPGLQEAVDRALQELKDDGTLQEILDRWIPPYRA